MIALRSIVVVSLAAPFAHAHTGERLRPHDLWAAWSFEPGIVIPLALGALLYACGARLSRGITRSQLACFASGYAMLAFALMSPLHAAGEVLFSVHMVQHEILMLVVAPLLVLSRPLVPLLWALPLPMRRMLGQGAKSTWIQKTWRMLTRPMAAWWVHAAALWIWHAPPLFQAAVENEWIHALQHLSFLASALLFWWALFYARGTSGYGAGVLYVFTTAIHTSILGALLTFAPQLWYAVYGTSARDWGLTPLEDQQIGGLIMWVPAGVVYLAAGLTLFAAWLRESDTAALRRNYVE